MTRRPGGDVDRRVDADGEELDLHFQEYWVGRGPPTREGVGSRGPATARRRRACWTRSPRPTRSCFCPSNPVVVDRADPRGPGRPRGDRSAARARGGHRGDRRRRSGRGDGGPADAGSGPRGDRRRGGAAYRACSELGDRRARRARWPRGSRRAGVRVGVTDTIMATTTRPERAGARRPGAGPRAVTRRGPSGPGAPRDRPGDDLAELLAPPLAGSAFGTATWSWSPRRSSRRPRAGVVPEDEAGAMGRAGDAAGRRAARRPGDRGDARTGSCAPTPASTHRTWPRASSRSSPSDPDALGRATPRPAWRERLGRTSRSWSPTRSAGRGARAGQRGDRLRGAAGARRPPRAPPTTTAASWRRRWWLSPTRSPRRAGW